MRSKQFDIGTLYLFKVKSITVGRNDNNKISVLTHFTYF